MYTYILHFCVMYLHFFYFLTLYLYYTYFQWYMKRSSRVYLIQQYKPDPSRQGIKLHSNTKKKK